MQNLLLAKLFEKVKFDKAFDFTYIFKSIITRWYLYVLLLVVFLALFMFAYFKKQPKRNQLTKTQRLAYIAMLCATSVAVNVIQIPFPLIQVSFVATIAFLAGVLLGAVDGFAVAFLGDLIAGIVAPTGIYTPVIGIGTGLLAFVPGLIFSHVKAEIWVKGVISYAITFVLTSVLLNTVGLGMLYTYMTVAERIALLPLTLLVHAINCVLSILITMLLKRTLPPNKFYI